MKPLILTSVQVLVRGYVDMTVPDIHRTILSLDGQYQGETAENKVHLRSLLYVLMEYLYLISQKLRQLPETCQSAQVSLGLQDHLHRQNAIILL